MKILIVTRGVPSSKNPMWGNFELDQAKALKEEGHQVVCYSLDRNISLNGIDFKFSKKLVDQIPMYNQFLPMPYRFLSKKIESKLIERIVKKNISEITKAEGGFDIVHGHYLPNITIAKIIKGILNIPAVGTEHWSELKRNKIRDDVYLEAKETYNDIDSLITVSNPLSKIVMEKFGVSSNFVGCVVDNVFTYQKLRPDGIFRFVSVGTLLKIKGFDMAIRSFKDANFAENVHYYIVGDGKERAKLEGLIDELNLKDSVFLVGRQSREYIMDLYTKSHAYVLSSSSENFATASMEALSAGIPVIMTKCGGPEDFVDSTNSILTEVGSIKQMSESMKFMKNNIENFNRLSISENIRKKYSAKSIAEQLIEIYERQIG